MPGREPRDPQDAGLELHAATDVYVARWQAGDEAAFDMLYARFAPLLRVRVRRSPSWPILERTHQVEDVVQDVWAKTVPAAQRRFRPSGPGSFLAFLSKLCDRTVIDLSRRNRAVKRNEGAAHELKIGAEERAVHLPGASVAATPTSHARYSDIDEIARQTLSEREYEAWELVELQDYTAAEAGLALDCSASAVRGLLLRARAKLVRRLGEEDV